MGVARMPDLGPSLLYSPPINQTMKPVLGWAGRRGGGPKTEMGGTALGSNPEPAT